MPHPAACVVIKAGTECGRAAASLNDRSKPHIFATTCGTKKCWQQQQLATATQLTGDPSRLRRLHSRLQLQHSSINSCQCSRQPAAGRPGDRFSPLSALHSPRSTLNQTRCVPLCVCQRRSNSANSRLLLLQLPALAWQLCWVATATSSGLLFVLI